MKEATERSVGGNLVYVAGPIHGSGTVEANVAAAIEAGEELRSAGLFVVVPHINVLWSFSHRHDSDWWLSNDMELLSRCDALLRLPGESPGADAEVEFALARGLPVFVDTASVVAELGFEQPTSTCPGCGAEVEDFDGFGVLAHLRRDYEDGCGYCSHPSQTEVEGRGMVCGVCCDALF